MQYIKAWIDGSCEPMNPGGNMGWGVHIEIEGQALDYAESIRKDPKNTSNVAEYLALIKLLSELQNIVQPTMVIVSSDSAMLVNQMNKRWRIKKGSYAETAYRALIDINNLRNLGYSFEFHWIPREENEIADRLSKSFSNYTHSDSIRKSSPWRDNTSSTDSLSS